MTTLQIQGPLVIEFSEDSPDPLSYLHTSTFEVNIYSCSIFPESNPLSSTNEVLI